MPRQWPLLADDQDPASLEARIAFHLHRLGLVGARLKQCGYYPTHKVHLIAQGRVTFTSVEKKKLAAALRVSVDDLSRNLTPHEKAAWHFYRVSARNRDHVWRRAKAAWEHAGLTMTKAAAIMQIPPSRVSEAFKRNDRILDYEEAFRLSAALRFPGGPSFLLEHIDTGKRPESNISNRGLARIDSASTQT